MNHAEFRKKILAANDEAAGALKRRFDAAGTLVVDLVASPGAGKTSLLEASARHLPVRLRTAAIVGDIATDLDSERLSNAGIRAHQIVTGGACHLDARLVTEAVEHTPFPDLDVLFIENVGNLVCPASYALGEDFKVVALSVTEGPDKPFKYPAIFAKAAVTVITKADLLPYVSFNLHAVRDRIMTLNPDARVIVTSATTDHGLDSWCGLLERAIEAKQAKAAPVGVGL
jgi:hydrogenase nickel incorporation protein HypB